MNFEDFEPLEPDEQQPQQQKQQHRCTDLELELRIAEAVALLDQGLGTAYPAKVLADRYGVTLRQARKYVNAAFFEWAGTLSRDRVDREQLNCLMISENLLRQAIESGDLKAAGNLNKQRSYILNQADRMISRAESPRRVSLRRSHTRPTAHS